jgi:hypothetical protein
MPMAEEYVARSRESEINLKGGDWEQFKECCQKYAELRKMSLT